MKNNYIKSLLFLFMATTVFASSCGKEQFLDDTGEKGKVAIKIDGIGHGNADSKMSLRASTVSDKSAISPTVQTVEVDFNDQYSVTAILTPVGVATSVPAFRASANRSELNSTGPELEELADGSSYVVAVYDTNGNYKDHQVFIHNTGNAPQYQFELEPGTYTFLAVATEGSDNSWMAGILEGQPLAELNLTGLDLDADLDVLWQKKENVNIKAGSNIVNVVMDHLFTQITVTFDATAVGDINSIYNATITPNHKIAGVNLATGGVSFDPTLLEKNVSFSNQSGPSWTSKPVMIGVEATSTGEVTLNGVNINGTTGSITFDGLSFEKGVKYDLQLKLKKKGTQEIEGFEIGGMIWAPGNLLYNNGNYGFTARQDQQGDYWYPNYLNPLHPDHNNKGEEGDPCGEIASGSWRLPTVGDIEALINATGGNPGEPWGNIQRYVDYYETGISTKVGIFFGVNSHENLGNNRDQYLHIPYWGTGGAPNHPEGWYLVSTTGNGRKIAVMRGKQGDLGMNLGWWELAEDEQEIGHQIRCVRDAG